MMHRYLLLVLTSTMLLLSSCAQKAEVKEENVARIIQTLSADEMKGRHAFSPEIEKAAEFISDEFQRIGLQPLPGEDQYLQDFTIHAISPSQTSVEVNNEAIEEKHFFGLLHTETFSWKNEDAEIGYISEDDSYREKFREFASNDVANFIAVHEVHEKWFHRYRTYFSRSNRTFELGKDPNDVFVLSSEPIRSYDVEFQNKTKAIPLFNVAGMIEGENPDEIVLFSAHYDHLGVISPVDEDSIANGANDNASGVAGVIELARYYSSQSKPERTIYFVAFTAEEPGGYGSKYFSEQIEPEKITAMINVEMIGKPAIEGPNSGWITGFEFSNLGEILQNNTPDSIFTFYPDPYTNQNLFYRSDNAPFASLGIPAHTISTTPIDMDQDYHRVTDEFGTLDITHTTNTIQAIAEGAEAIVSRQQTPTRINPDSLQ